MAENNPNDQDNIGSLSTDSPKQKAVENGGGGHSGTSGSPSHKDAALRKEKEKEREDRIRAVKERQKAERQRKIDELLESQRQAQELRNKQQELRRQKIEELRRREEERRAAVDERRRKREETERAKREAILAKTSERLARYEAWKASGKGKGQIPGYVTPSKRLSASTSVLYHKKTPDLGSPGHLNASMRNLPSAHALGTIPENRSFLASRGATPHRPRSTVGLHTPKSSDNTNVQLRPSRKPRPASIAGNLPGFVTLSPPSSTVNSRSKSSERLQKEKPRPRPQSMGPERKRREADEKSDSQKSQTPPAKNLRRTTISTIERLSVPKHSRDKTDGTKSGENNSQKETPNRKSKNRSRKPKTPGKENLDDNASTGTADSTPSKDSVTVPKATRNATPKPSKTEAVSNPAPSESDHENINKPPSEEEEYKAKLAERRRQAREKAEREAEEERLKIEEERLKEEERQRQEEEDQRRMEEEAHRFAEEARQAEEERLRIAIEAEETRRREEAERLEQEKIAKEEADKKAKEEAERLEKEKQEKAKKDEEERLERKKRLESIMKRVKTDTQLDSAKNSESPAKSNQGSPVKSSSSIELSNEDKTDEEGGLSPEDSNAEDESSTTTEDKVPDEEGRPKFSSPLLKQLMDKRAEDSPGDERPKFKSPLLQNLLGKNKGMARSSSEKSLSDSKSDTEDSDVVRQSSVQRKLISEDNYDSYNGKTEANGDNHETLISNTNGDIDKEVVRQHSTDELQSAENTSSVQGETTLLKITEPSEDLHCNGLEIHGVNDNSQGLVDSSISMRTDDTGRSLTSSFRDDDLVTSIEPPGELASQEVSGEGRFEEIIDLSVSNKNLNFEETTTTNLRSEDLLNFNSLDGQSEETPKAPFIAFEDNAVNRQDVTPDLLS